MQKNIKEVDENNFIKWLNGLDKNSGAIAGGKGANLAEMFIAKFPVPPAFVVTTSAYNYFIEEAKIKEKIYELLESIDVDDTKELEEKAEEIRKIITNAEMPEELSKEIIEAYEDLSIEKKALESARKDALAILSRQEPIFVAVRSSATTEDLAEASFAGQQETYLNIKGNKELIIAVKKVFASLFTARAIYYRKKRGFSKEKFALAAIVQKMIDSEKSGVIFSRNPIKENNHIVIEAVFGLGEGIVSGRIKPDNYEVSRELKIIDKKIADKKIAITRNSQGSHEIVSLVSEKSKEQVLKDHEIKNLADYAIRLEEHYEKPQDIEFAIENGEIYIVQTRQITTSPKKTVQKIKGEEILNGLAASPGIASGKVKIIKNLSDLKKVQKGDVLVTEMTNPDMVVTMQKSAAIVTDEGGITCHASIVSREMGIPCVVGTEKATSILLEGQIVTVDGYSGKVYLGASETVKAEVKPVVQTKTKIKLILDLPEAVERASKSNIESIGLLRLEGIIASSGKHPILFLKQKKLDEYTELLAKGIEKISKPFKEIWIRTSDIRSDEYSNLEGAPSKIELNPMLGMHGIRFSLKHKEILIAELNAIKKCAEGDKKFGIMMPQIISPQEIAETKRIIQEIGLNNVKIGIMVETPAACFIIGNLVKAGIDFISLGTNDLTQYVLAIDRGNEEVQYIYNEMHPAVLNAIKRVIRTCKEFGIESSICGQAGSNKEMVKFLIENGIDSISVNADAAYEISVYVAELEKEIETQRIKTQALFQEKREFAKSRFNKFKKNGKFKKFSIQGGHEKQANENQKSPEDTIQEITKKAEHEKERIIEEIYEEVEKEKNVQRNPRFNEKKIQKPQSTREQEKKVDVPSYIAKSFAPEIKKLEKRNIKEQENALKLLFEGVEGNTELQEQKEKIPSSEEYHQYENNLQQQQVEPKNLPKPGTPAGLTEKKLTDEEMDHVLDIF